MVRQLDMTPNKEFAGCGKYVEGCDPNQPGAECYSLAMPSGAQLRDRAKGCYPVDTLARRHAR